MRHSLGNRGQITMRYISPYTIQERKQYNNLLLGIKEDTEASRNLVSINRCFSICLCTYAFVR